MIDLILERLDKLVNSDKDHKDIIYSPEKSYGYGLPPNLNIKNLLSSNEDQDFYGSIQNKNIGHSYSYA